MFASRFAGAPVQVRLEAIHFRGQLIFPLAQLAERFRISTIGFSRYILGDVALPLDETFRSAHGVLHVTLQRSRLTALQQPPSLPQAVERRRALALSTTLSCARRSSAHLVGGISETSSGFSQLGVSLLTCQPLELTRELFGLFGQPVLPPTAVRRAGLGPGPFVQLLLSARELLELLERLVHLLVAVAPLAPLHALILVPQAIQLEVEQVGQVLDVASAPTATTSALLTHGDLNVPECGLGALQVLQRPLLG